MANDFHQHLLDHIDKVSGPPSYPRLGKTLRAVAEVHAPEMFGGIVACLACSPGMPPQILVEAPCPTIRAIARELGVSE